MKRCPRNKAKRIRNERAAAKFSYARLEPRQLLAGDFATTEFVNATPLTNISKIDIEACTELDSESNNLHQCEVKIDGRPFFVVVSDNMLSGSDYAYSTIDNYDWNTIGLVSNSFGSAGGASDPLESTPTISIPVVELNAQTPLEKTSLAKSEDGQYFKDSKLAETGTAEEQQLNSKAGSRLGMLGQQQMFSVISPTEATPETFGMLAKSIPTRQSSPSFYSLSYRQIDLAFSSMRNSLEHRFAKTQSSTKAHVARSIERRDLPNGFNVDVKRESDSLHRPTAKPIELSKSQRPVDFNFSTYSKSFESKADKPEQLELELMPLMKPVESNEDAPTKTPPAVGLQIVESAILLIGLPNSRLFRDDETAVNRPG